MRRIRHAIAIAAMITIAGPAFAQNVSPDDGGALSNALSANMLVSRTRTALERQLKHTPSATVPPPARNARSSMSLRFETSPAASAVPVIANNYPASNRRDAAALFRDLLREFGSVEQRFGQPDNDLPTALALFIASSYEASNGIAVPPERARPLIDQMRETLLNEPGITNASAAEKQGLYEQLAITGMMNTAVTLELKLHPDPVTSDQMKAAGRAYLVQLGLNPDRMHFTDKGLETD